MPMTRLLAVLLVAVALAGCGKKKRDAGGQSYTVRAQVEAVSGRQLTLRHEAIPDFVNAFGERSGMEAMAMPFGVGDGVALDGIAAGDLVEIKCRTDWNAKPPLRIDAIRELPADTKLAL